MIIELNHKHKALKLSAGGKQYEVFATGIDMGDSIDEPIKIVMPRQTHTSHCEWVGRDDADAEFADTDALITQRTDIALGIRTADCTPIMLYAPQIKTIAAIHAGWRGTLAGITRKTIARLIEAGQAADKIEAIFGPVICRQCYETDQSLAQQFINAGYGDAVFDTPIIDPLTNRPWNNNKPHIDLQVVNCRQMTDCGLKPQNITTTQLCTRHTKTAAGRFMLNSWRRMPGTEHRNITIIRLCK